MRREELFKLWLIDPNKVEQYMLQTKTKKEESLVRSYIKDFIAITGVTEIRNGPGMGVRIVGEGLIHDQQENIESLETIYGSFSGKMNDLKSEINDFKKSRTYEILTEIGFSKGEIKDLFFTEKSIVYKKISEKLKENEDRMSLNILIDTPTEILGGLIQYIWSKMVKYPGRVLSAEEKNGTIIVFLSGEVGKFIGQSGKNIERMKSLLNKDISAYSLEEAN